MTWQATLTVTDVSTEGGQAIVAASSTTGSTRASAGDAEITAADLLLTFAGSTEITVGDEILLTGALLSVGRPASV